MHAEKLRRPINGYILLGVAFLIVIAYIAFVAPDRLDVEVPAGLFADITILFVVLLILILKGLVVISPNSARVLLLFGAYKGTIRQSGLFWVNPFYKGLKLSLRARNFESEQVKVNDKMGNPILISVILVWKVGDTSKAVFDVDNYENFIRIQTDSAVRKLAASYAYDHFEDEKAAITLSTDFDEVNRSLEKEIAERLVIAGIEVVEARISHLSYAPEIAHSMLRRQQATAVVAARNKIVEGAVSMVENALHLLSSKNIIDLDEDKKAAMVSNLMVVLCGDRETQPVVNTGTLNQ